MIELDSNEGNFLKICRHYLAIYNTSTKPVSEEDPKDDKKVRAPF